MTRTSASGSRTPQGADAFSPTSQLADFADDEAKWNNVIVVADATARNALSSPQLRDGIIAVQKSDNTVWLCTAATGPSWVRIRDDSGWITPGSIQNSFTNPGGDNAIRYRRLNGVVYVQGGPTRASAPTNPETVFVLPSGYRPGVRLIFQTSASAAAEAVQLRVLPTGEVQVQCLTGRSASPGYSIAGPGFPADQ
jgi:hypothetical protein